MSLPRLQVNLGNFHGRARAVEESPTLSLQKDSAPVVGEDARQLHVALVKLGNPELLDERILQGIGQTLGQLSRLSISPCVVVDTDTTIGTVGHIWRQKLVDQAERVVAAVDSNSGPGSARVGNILTNFKL
jgi:amino-acid N-acetyltransferase